VDFTAEQLKNYIKDYQKRGKEAYSRSRSTRVDIKDRAKYHRDYLDSQAMIRNINSKLTKNEWLYDDLPNGHHIKHFRVLASGDPNRVGKLIDGFGREYDVSRERN
tara:strand:- start:2549 stop:2866 length:318 start_codon:yes stop_codon:yes gene_type:complete